MSIETEPQIQNKSVIVPVFFFLLFLLLALRHETLGRDLGNYHTYFDYFSQVDFSVLLKEERDILYWLLNWVVGQFTDSYQIFLAVVAAITILPIAKLYSEDRQYGFLKMILFMNMSNFVMLFSGLRQAIAVSIGLLAYDCVRKKRPVRFLLLAMLALGIHHTAFMIFLYYPLYHLRLRKKHLWFIIPSVGAVFIFNKQIFRLLGSFLVSFMGDKYDVEIENTGAYTMIILFALFAIVAYVLPDEKKMDGEAIGLRNFLLMALLLQLFAPLNNLSMRMNYYYIIFIPIVIPKMLKYTKDNIKDVAKIANGVMVAFFVVYYLYTTYQSCRTGISALDTYPYMPFWEYQRY